MQEKLVGDVKSVSVVKNYGSALLMELQIDFDTVKIFGQQDEIMAFMGKRVYYTLRDDIIEGVPTQVVASIAEVRVIDVVKSVDNIKLIPMTQKRNVCNFSIRECKYGEFYPGCIALLTAIQSGSSRKTQWVDCTLIDQESKEFSLRIFTKNNLDNAMEIFKEWLGSYVTFDMKVTQYGNQTEEIAIIQDTVTISPEVEVSRKVILNEIANDPALDEYEKTHNLMKYIKSTIDGEPGYMLVRMASEIYMINALANISNDFDIQAMKRAVYTSRGYLKPHKKNWSRPMLNSNCALRCKGLQEDTELLLILDVMSQEEVSPTKSMYIRIRKMVDDCIKMEKGVVMFDGKPSIVDRFTGNAAEVKFGNDKYEVKYTEAPVLANADGNDKGIDESNMTKFKDALYFTLYLDTYLTMYKKVGDGKYIYVQTGSESTPKDSMIQQAYNVLEQTPVTGDSKFKVKTDGGFTIKAPDGVELQTFKNKVSVKNNIQVTYG